MQVLPTCFEGRRLDFSSVHEALKVLTGWIVANEVSRRNAACRSSGPQVLSNVEVLGVAQQVAFF